MFLRNSENTALIWKDEVVTYNQLLLNVTKCTTLFDGMNTSKIAIYAENRPEWVYSFYSGMMTESILVPIDFMLPPEDVAYILNDCTPEVIFYSKETEERVNEALADTSHPIRKICIDDINLDEINCEAQTLPQYNDDDVFIIV